MTFKSMKISADILRCDPSFSFKNVYENLYVTWQDIFFFQFSLFSKMDTY